MPAATPPTSPTPRRDSPTPAQTPAQTPAASGNASAAGWPRALPRRFGVRTLLLAATAMAFCSAMVTQLPRELTMLLVSMLWIAAAAWLASGLLFARGPRQAFCLGGVLALCSLWSRVGGAWLEVARNLLLGLLGVSRYGNLAMWLDLLLVLAMAWGAGKLCVAMRRRHLHDASQW